MTFLRVDMYVFLRWNRDLFHSHHQQHHTTIKTECPEKLDWDVIVLLGSWGFQDTQDMYTNADTWILMYTQGFWHLILIHPHWELLCFYSLSIWALGRWNTDGLQRTNMLFNLGPLSRTMKLLLQPLPTNCSLHAFGVLELLDSSEDKSHSLQDDLLL